MAEPVGYANGMAVLAAMGYQAIVCGRLSGAARRNRFVMRGGSLFALALTGKRRWGAVAPLGGTCLILGWASLVLAAATA